jgi:hypothetical protein
MRFRAHISMIFLILFMDLHAQVPEYTRQVVKSFRAARPVTVDIGNKYGKVQVITWDIDSVKFVIDLRIRSKDGSKLEKLKQTIDFEFTTGQSYLVARTKLGDTGTDVFKDIVDIAGSYLSANNSVMINYTVMIPDYAQLKIDNKFGDVFIDDLNGNLNLVLSYGDLTCNRLNAKSEIRITSGNAEVNAIRDGIVFISYGNLHIRECERLTADTRSSNITIDRSASLKVNSRRDKLFLNDIGSLSGTGYFSQLNGGILREEVNFTGRYGNITLDKIKESFTQVNITAEYADVSIGFEKPPLFNFELTHHQDVVFVYPKSLASLKTRVVSAEDKQFLTSGIFGTGVASSNVVINAPRRCKLTLTYR